MYVIVMLISRCPGEFMCVGVLCMCVGVIFRVPHFVCRSSEAIVVHAECAENAMPLDDL